MKKRLLQNAEPAQRATPGILQQLIEDRVPTLAWVQLDAAASTIADTLIQLVAQRFGSAEDSPDALTAAITTPCGIVRDSSKPKACIPFDLYSVLAGTTLRLDCVLEVRQNRWAPILF